MRATSISGEGMFGARIMAGVADMASSVPRLVPVEVVELLRAMFRQRSTVTVMRVIAVVDVAVEAMRAVKPGASSDKYPANKPIRPIVAVGSTVIGSIVEIPIGTDGRRPNVYANANLGWRQRRTAQQDSCESSENEQMPFRHVFTSICLSCKVSVELSLQSMHPEESSRKLIQNHLL
jgi:hypothetical protein